MIYTGVRRQSALLRSLPVLTSSVHDILISLVLNSLTSLHSYYLFNPNKLFTADTAYVYQVHVKLCNTDISLNLILYYIFYKNKIFSNVKPQVQESHYFLH